MWEIYYLGNVLIHIEDGKVSPIYDCYGFIQNGVWTAVIVATIILPILYTISLILWRFNNIK